MRVSYDTVFVFAYTNNVYYRCVCVCVICGPRPVLVRVRWPSRGELGVELIAVVLRHSGVVVVYLPIHKIRVAKYTVLDAVRPVQLYIGYVRPRRTARKCKSIERGNFCNCEITFPG